MNIKLDDNTDEKTRDGLNHDVQTVMAVSELVIKFNLRGKELTAIEVHH